MDVGSELAAFVGMPEKVAEESKEGAESLERDMPPGADNL